MIVKLRNGRSGVVVTTIAATAAMFSIFAVMPAAQAAGGQGPLASGRQQIPATTFRWCTGFGPTRSSAEAAAEFACESIGYRPILSTASAQLDGSQYEGFVEGER